MTDRDRDMAGRARNSRPRDVLGRPLPRGATGVDPLPDDLSLPPEDSLSYAQDLLDQGLAFKAHEVLEAAWKAAPAALRELWRGLAQLAVGLTHARRGNAAGAVELLRRSADRIAAYPTAPYRIDTARLVEWTRALASRIERDGLAGVSGPELVPRLRSDN